MEASEIVVNSVGQPIGVLEQEESASKLFRVENVGHVIQLPTWSSLPTKQRLETCTKGKYGHDSFLLERIAQAQSFGTLFVSSPKSLKNFAMQIL